MKNLLVVVDMVNGFVKFGALADKNINKITPTIINAIEYMKASNFDLIAFKGCHSINDEEFKIYPAHCLKGTPENELIDELKPYEKYFDHIIDKNTTDGFVTPEFQKIVKENVYDQVFITGCCTDICVLNFFESYNKYVAENNLDTKFVILENACATFDAKNHNAEEMHSKAIAKMENEGAKILYLPTETEEDDETL